MKKKTATKKTADTVTSRARATKAAPSRTAARSEARAPHEAMSEAEVAALRWLAEAARPARDAVDGMHGPAVQGLMNRGLAVGESMADHGGMWFKLTPDGYAVAKALGGESK